MSISFGSIVNDLALVCTRFFSVATVAASAVFGNDNSAGIVWSPATNSSLDGYTIRDIAWGNDTFIAVGSKPRYGEVIDSKIAYSPDGITWTVVKNNPFGTSNITAIAWGNSKFVAVGDGGKIAYSSDGVTWTFVMKNPFGAATTISAIAYGNGRFVAGGGYSDYGNNCSDGKSFTPDRGKIAYSSDGITWTEVKNDTIFEDFRITNIVYGNNKFIVTTESNAVHCESEIDLFGRIAYSYDGISWTNVKNDGRTVSAIAFGNDMFVAGDMYDEMNGGGGAMYSSDGITWTAVANDAFNALSVFAVVWGNNNFLITGSKYEYEEEKKTYEIMYSSNGITWIPVENYPFGDSPITAIAWGKDRFVAGSADGKIALSLTNIELANDNANYSTENTVQPNCSDAECVSLSTGKLVLDAVYFTSGKADIHINSKPYLNTIASMLVKYPKMKIEIGGHTDNIGEFEANMNLSRSRAEAVLLQMVNTEPSLSRMLSYNSYGSTMPIADNKTAGGRELNRRIELKVLNPEVLQGIDRDKTKTSESNSPVYTPERKTLVNTTDNKTVKRDDERDSNRNFSNRFLIAAACMGVITLIWLLVSPNTSSP